MDYHEEKDWENIDFKSIGIRQAQYEDCRFIQCDFAGLELHSSSFTDCEFIDCNLSNVDLKGVTLNQVKFKRSKMLGLGFEGCSDFLFSVDFESCQLDYSSFYKRNLKKQQFRACSLKEVDFTDANLEQAIFSDCDLAGAKFENTRLEKADLHTSFNISVDPDFNKVKGALFSLQSLPGLLEKHGIKIKN